MAQLISSKVSVEREAPKIRAIPGVPTAVAAMMGVTEKGPLTPTRTTSFDEWVDLYGGFIAASKMAAIIEHFFKNDGVDLWFQRIVHLNSQLDPATKTSAKGTATLSTGAVVATAGVVLSSRQEPYLLAPGDTLDFSVDGAVVDTATFDATAGSLATTNVGPYTLADGLTLKVKVDGGVEQTVTFKAVDFGSIAAATAQEVVDVVNRDTFGLTASVSAGTVLLTSDRQGTSSSIEVTGGTAVGIAPLLDFAAGVNSGTGDVAFIDAVTVAEIKTVVEADITPAVTVTDVSGRVQIETNTLGTGGSIEVKATSTADTKIGLDNLVHTGTDAGTFNTLRVDGKYDGAYANDLRIVIADPTSGLAGEFNLVVQRNGASVEVFPNVTMDDAALNFVEKAINDTSTLIAVTDLDAATTAALQAPKKGSFVLAGGDDGLTGLADADYVGSQAGGTGVRVFDQIDEIRVLVAPDRPTAIVQNALLDYAEVTRDRSMFVPVTVPEGLTAAQAVDFVKNTANLLGKTENGAVYWPHVKIVNPAPAAFGDTPTITVPPTGAVAGTYARIDAARDGGVYDEPAGLERGLLLGVVELETEEVNDERKRDFVVGSAFINPIRTRPGAPFFIDDVLVLKRDGNFPTVAQSRGVIFIEQSLKEGLESFRQRANDEDTRDEAAQSARVFLLVQFKNKAFRGTTPEDSFFVDTGTKINTPVIIAQEKLIMRVGVATQRPARFVILRLSQDLRDVEAELAAALG